MPHRHALLSAACALSIAAEFAQANGLPHFYVHDVDPGASATVMSNGLGPDNFVAGLMFDPSGSGFLVEPRMPLVPLAMPAGASAAAGQAVNSSGQVAGYAEFPDGETHATLTGPDGVGITDLGVLPGGFLAFSTANGVNESGQVVGSSITGIVFRAYITDAGGANMRELGTLIDSSLAAAYGLAINASGQVAGQATASSLTLVKHAFLSDPGGGALHDLGTLGGSEATSTATAVNDAGVVAGYSTLGYNDTTPHAFLTGPNGHGMRDLGTLDGFGTQANGVNSFGNVVGVAISPDQSSKVAFATGARGQGLIDLNTVLINSPTQMVSALSINDLGNILAQGADGHAYLLCRQENCQ